MPEAAAKLESAFHPHELVHQLLRVTFDSSPIGFGICDADLRIVIVNNAWAAMDGRLPEQHIGKTVIEVLGVDCCPVEPVMKQVLRTGKPVFGLEIIAKIPARPSVERWIVNLIPLKDESGKTTHVGSITIQNTPKTGFESFLVARGNAVHHASALEKQDDRIKVDKLSPRMIQVARLLAESKSNKEIAVILKISQRTVECYRSLIFRTLDIHSLAELVLYAVRERIITVKKKQ